MNIARSHGRSKCSARVVAWDWQRRNVPPPTAARSVGADAFIGPLGCDSHRAKPRRSGLYIRPCPGGHSRRTRGAAVGADAFIGPRREAASGGGCGGCKSPLPRRTQRPPCVKGAGSRSETGGLSTPPARLRRATSPYTGEALAGAFAAGALHTQPSGRLIAAPTARCVRRKRGGDTGWRADVGIGPYATLLPSSLFPLPSSLLLPSGGCHGTALICAPISS